MMAFRRYLPVGDLTVFQGLESRKYKVSFAKAVAEMKSNNNSNGVLIFIYSFD